MHKIFIFYLYLKILTKYPTITDVKTNNVNTPVFLLIVTAPIKQNDATAVGTPHHKTAPNILDISTGCSTITG